MVSSASAALSLVCLPEKRPVGDGSAQEGRLGVPCDSEESAAADCKAEGGRPSIVEGADSPDESHHVFLPIGMLKRANFLHGSHAANHPRDACRVCGAKMGGMGGAREVALGK